MRASKKIKRELTFRAIRTVAWFVSLLPRRVALRVGSLVGLAGYGLMGRARHLTLEHLGAAYPASTPGWRRATAMRCFINLVWNAVDFLYFSRRDAGALSAVCEVRGNEHLERALRKGTGVLCVSAHVGNWELLPARVAHMGFRVAVVARKLYYPKLDQWVNSLRRRMGVEVLDRDDPPGRIFSRLRRGYVVGVLTDQDTRTRGVFVEFFGRPANTPVGPALIAMRSGSPIMPVFIRRMPGHSYQVAFGEECTSRGPATLKGAETLTQWATGRIEEAIRSSPEQWVWMHRRWRRRPKDTG